jgi:hypothetical protein
MTAREQIQAAVEVLARASAGDATLSVDARALLTSARDEVDGLNATQHPLGFLHLDLTPLAGPVASEVRLHVWTQDSVTHADELGMKHDHVWELKSVVLVGCLTDVTMTAVPDPNGEYGMAAVEYGVQADRARSDGGRFSVQTAATRRVRGGHWYSVPAGVLHETEVEEFPTATLVLARPQESRGPRVLTRLDLSDRDYVHRREALRPDLAREALTIAIRAVPR